MALRPERFLPRASDRAHDAVTPVLVRDPPGGTLLLLVITVHTSSTTTSSTTGSTVTVTLPRRGRQSEIPISGTVSTSDQIVILRRDFGRDLWREDLGRRPDHDDVLVPVLAVPFVPLLASVPVELQGHLGDVGEAAGLEERVAHGRGLDVARAALGVREGGAPCHQLGGGAEALVRRVRVDDVEDCFVANVYVCYRLAFLFFFLFFFPFPQVYR